MAVITFAHRGGRAHAPENTLRAFTIARELGASGLESDVWLSVEGEPVLVHDERLWRGLTRISVARSTAEELGRFEIPRLTDLFDALGSDFELSLDLKDRLADDPTVEVVRRRGDPARTWICAYSVTRLKDLRSAYEDIRLVNSRPRDRINGSIERHAARLAEARIDAMNMHYSEWNAGLVTLFHRFGVRAFAWDAQHVRNLRAMLAIGIDAVYSDRVDTMVETVAEWTTES